MSEDWINIFTSSKLYEIELIRGLLLENDIESFVINKQDSAYLFGEIELLVQFNDVLKAKQIITNNNNSE